MKRSGSILRAGVAVVLALWTGAYGWSRQTGPGEGAAVVVEGKVVGAYQSAVPQQEGLLVEIQARRSELGALPLGNARVDVPSPGDLLYVHVASTRGRVALPAPGTEVRVFLVPRDEGGWQGRANTWFEPLNAPEPRPMPQPIPDRAPTAPAPAGASALDLLGLSADELDVQGKYVLRVTAVERGKPAGQAGLEVGDIVIGYDGQPLGSPDALAARVAKGGTISLMVVDINTGKVAQVPVELARASAPAEPPGGLPTPTPTPRTEPSPAPSPRRSLGITAEPVTVNGRTALKVARVDPNGPGGKAGLEPGDVLVAANGAPLTGPEQLAAALRKSGPTMTLTVRDTRTGKDVPVEVDFGEPVATSTPAPAPVPVPAPTPTRTGAGGGLGAVTELVFLDTEAAVKVTEVLPNSPAARAGLEPGDIIVQAAGKPVLHPNELTEAVRQASGSLDLTVIGQGTNRRRTVRVELGR